MKVPCASTALERSAVVSCSAAGGGGKMKGNRKKPSATPNAVPSTAPAKKMASERSMAVPDGVCRTRIAGNETSYAPAGSCVTSAMAQSSHDQSQARYRRLPLPSACAENKSRIRNFPAQHAHYSLLPVIGG